MKTYGDKWELLLVALTKFCGFRPFSLVCRVFSLQEIYVSSKKERDQNKNNWLFLTLIIFFGQIYHINHNCVKLFRYVVFLSCFSVFLPNADICKQRPCIYEFSGITKTMEHVLMEVILHNVCSSITRD